MWLIKEGKVLSQKLAENIPLIDGIYKGYFYSWILEINDIEYKTLFGVRCTKEGCGGIKEFLIKNKSAYEV